MKSRSNLLCITVLSSGILAASMALGTASPPSSSGKRGVCRDFSLSEVFQMTQSGKETKRKAPADAGVYAGHLGIDSRFTAKDFVPDGNLDKPAWQTAQRIRFQRAAMGDKEFPESETQVASLWSSGFVYFAYWCKYDTLNIYEGEDIAKERWELWDRDVVEVFINPEPRRFHHYYEFEVAPNNQWIDLEIDLEKKPFNSAAWDSRFEHATHIDPAKRVWTCEFRIPVASLGVPHVRERTEWRLNFYRADGPGDDTKRRFLSWSPLPGKILSFHQPASFSIIRFMK